MEMILKHTLRPSRGSYRRCTRVHSVTPPLFYRVRAATNFASSQAPSESTNTTPLPQSREPEPAQIDEMSSRLERERIILCRIRSSVYHTEPNVCRYSKRKHPQEPQVRGSEPKKKRLSPDAPPFGSPSMAM
jgi:transposase-like protein